MHPEHVNRAATILDPSPPSPEELGARISRLRTEQGMSMSVLASKAGVSAALISQIEGGTGNPSYTTLVKVAHALEVPVTDFFTLADDDFRWGVVRKDERRALMLAGSDLIYELLTPTTRGRLSVVQSQVPPGWTNESTPFQHEGEEWTMVVEGEFFVTVGKAQHHLRAGDSITYDPTEPHWGRTGPNAGATVLAALTVPFI
jgi:transcriptional regulator with XRE-family HTH domain